VPSFKEYMALGEFKTTVEGYKLPSIWNGAGPEGRVLLDKLLVDCYQQVEREFIAVENPSFYVSLQDKVSSGVWDIDNVRMDCEDQIVSLICLFLENFIQNELPVRIVDNKVSEIENYKP